jgi:hypothetical protein
VSLAPSYVRFILLEIANIDINLDLYAKNGIFSYSINNNLCDDQSASNGFQIGFVAVAGKLNAICDPRRHILD